MTLAADASGWTEPDDVVSTLRARWDRGTYLRARADGVAWEPVRLRLSGPSAADLLEQTAASLAWIERMRSWALGGRGGPRCRLEDRVVRSRSLGHNDVPSHAVLDTIEDLAKVVGRSEQVAAFDGLLQLTAARLPEVVSWVAAHPMDVLDVIDDWPRMLDVVEWIVDNDTSRVYLRHLDLPGVDTKFVERHRKLLSGVLAVVLPSDRIDATASRFDARFGFRRVPSYLRFRLLSPVPGLPPGLSELSVRNDELARLELDVRTVFVVENQATYLAFPNVADAIVIFGSGFKVSTLETVPWLTERDLVYWGDIDTHGFHILDQLRARMPEVRSLLMDEHTLLAHIDRVGHEESPTSVLLTHLTPGESEMYRDLVEDRFGQSVRLEQERIRFGLLRAALAPWTATSAPGESGAVATGGPGR